MDHQVKKESIKWLNRAESDEQGKYCLENDAQTAWFCNQIPDSDYSSVLDIGSGTGRLVRYCQEILGLTFGRKVGVDCVQSDMAQSVYDHIHLGDMNQGLPEEEFDLVVSVQCLNFLHKDNSELFFDRLCGIMIPGGVFVATFPRFREGMISDPLAFFDPEIAEMKRILSSFSKVECYEYKRPRNWGWIKGAKQIFVRAIR